MSGSVPSSLLGGTPPLRLWFARMYDRINNRINNTSLGCSYKRHKLYRLTMAGGDLREIAGIGWSYYNPERPHCEALCRVVTDAEAATRLGWVVLLELGSQGDSIWKFAVGKKQPTASISGVCGRKPVALDGVAVEQKSRDPWAFVCFT